MQGHQPFGTTLLSSSIDPEARMPFVSVPHHFERHGALRVTPPLFPTLVAVNLRRLFPQASFVACGDIRTSAVTSHSQQCAPGILFAAIRGNRADGHLFIEEAIRRGASAL